MTLTKQHFILFANAIAKETSEIKREAFINLVTPIFEQQNPRFDINRFKAWIEKKALEVSKC